MDLWTFLTVVITIIILMSAITFFITRSAKKDSESQPTDGPMLSPKKRKALLWSMIVLEAILIAAALIFVLS